MGGIRGILWDQPRCRYRLLNEVLNNRLHFRLLCDHLMGMRLIGIHFIYESSLRAGHGWLESLCRL